MNQIVAAVRTCGVDLTKILVPGIGPDRLRQLLARGGYPYCIPSDVEELLRWANGTVGGQELIPLVWFPGANGMVGHYKDYLEVAENEGTPDFPPFRLYDDRWMPVFLDGGGGFYVTRGNTERMAESPIAYFIDWGPANEFQSLREFLKLRLECAESGVFYVQDGVFTVDLEKQQEIRSKYTRPVDLSFWYRER